jgi:hypothetical protein
MERARLMPHNWAKRAVITFIIKWFTENQLYDTSTDGDARPPPQPIDYASGELEARTGEPVLPVRAAFGRHDEVDHRREIVVQRGRFQAQRMHIGNQWDQIPIEYRGATLLAKRYTANEQIPITAWCTSTEGEEADMIAGFVYAAFQFWRIDVRKDYPGLRDIVSLALGEETLIERIGSTHEVIAVPVTVVLDIQYEWLIFQKDAHTLRNIITQVESGSECVEFLDGGDIPWPSS